MTPDAKKQRKRRALGSGLLISPALLGIVAAEIAVKVSPAAFPWLAGAGLVYPISAGVLILGLAWRLYAGRWMDCIVPLIVLGFTLPHLRQFLGGGWNDGGTGDLSLATWNVRQFDRYSWLEGEATRDALLSQLGTLEVDVLCLQEAYVDGRSRPFVTQNQIQAASGLTHIHTEFEHKKSAQEMAGVMTLTGLPIVQKQRITFTNDPGNGAIVTDVLWKGDTLRIVNAHLSSVHFEREDYDAVREGPDAQLGVRLWERLVSAWVKRADQAGQLRAIVESSPHPILVCGDFNDTSMSFALETLREVGLKDAFSEAGRGFGGTYIGDLPPLRIDYILHAEAFEALKVEVGEVICSDHRWVRSEFQWNP